VSEVPNFLYFVKGNIYVFCSLIVNFVAGIQSNLLACDTYLFLCSREKNRSSLASNDESTPSSNASSQSSPTSASTAASSDTSNTTDFRSLIPRIVVFGGSGFVGTKVCEHASRMGADVVSISRSGRPTWLQESPWADNIQWERGDAFVPDWKDLLKGATGVVSTLGTFGSNELMYRVCGLANMQLMDAAAEAGVGRFSFISVHDYAFPGGWHAKDFLLKGYFQGKRDAEAHLARVFPETGVAIRPGFIYGNRHAGGGGKTTVPLGLIGAPLAAALSLVPTRSLAGIPIIGAAFVPPTSVDTVGKAAAHAVLDDDVPAGVMDVWAMAQYA
jgi:nucleoside-diphosphate-sugar epimerase